MKKIVLIILSLMLGFCSLVFAVDHDTDMKLYVYTVKSGDTLSEIAWTLKIDRQKLVEWNPQAGIHNVYPDQEIKYFLSSKTPKVAERIIKSKDETAAIKTPAITNRTTAVLVAILVMFLILFIIAIVVVYERRFAVSKKVRFQIKGVKYIYLPRLDKDKKFISLHQNAKGNYLCYTDPNDLVRSLKRSFKKHPVLIEQEKNAGRLIPQGR